MIVECGNMGHQVYKEKKRENEQKLTRKLIKPFLANALIYNPWKHQKTFVFYVLRGYTIGTLARNGLITAHRYKIPINAKNETS